MKSKHLFLSKTFWANIAGLALSTGGLLPPKYSVPVLAIANIGLRLTTKQPVRILPKE